MIIEATKYSEVDETEKEIIGVRNRAKAVTYEAEKAAEKMVGKISETEKKTLKETLDKLNAALNGGNTQIIKEYTDELLELLDGLTMKVKIVSQAKILMYSIEKKLSDKEFSEEIRGIRETVKRLEEAPYKNTRKEMNKLKETIALLQAAHGER
jgi:hypothetical protein